MTTKVNVTPITHPVLYKVQVKDFFFSATEEQLEEITKAVVARLRSLK